MRRRQPTTLSLLIASSIVAALTVSTASYAQMSLPGGLGSAVSGLRSGTLPSLGGGILPSLSSASTSNVTGLLGYCVKNKLVGQGSTGGDVLAKLQGKPEAVQSPDYTSGLAGNLLGGKTAIPTSSVATNLAGLSGAANKPLSLDSLPAGLRTKVCDAVLNHAKSLL